MRFVNFFVVLCFSFFILVSCKHNENASKNYKWLDGTWVNADEYGDDLELVSCVIISDGYCQEMRYDYDDSGMTYIETLPKYPIEITIEFSEFLDSYVKTIGNFYIDEAKQQIYWLYDFDQKIYMKKK